MWSSDYEAKAGESVFNEMGIGRPSPRHVLGLAYEASSEGSLSMPVGLILCKTR